jgi:hypothetical protein
MSQSFIIPPRTTDGNEIRKFFVKVCQLINGTLETRNSLARAYLGTNQIGITSGTSAKVLLDVESFDLGNNFASYKYVCPVPGYYLVNFSAFISATGSVAKLFDANASIYKDGVLVCQGAFPYVYPNASAEFTYHVCPGSDIIYCDKSSYLELYVFSETDGITYFIGAGSAKTFMSVHLIST